MPTSSRLGFLNLPMEIRNMIYTQAVISVDEDDYLKPPVTSGWAPLSIYYLSQANRRVQSELFHVLVKSDAIFFTMKHGTDRYRNLLAPDTLLHIRMFLDKLSFQDKSVFLGRPLRISCNDWEPIRAKIFWIRFNNILPEVQGIKLTRASQVCFDEWPDELRAYHHEALQVVNELCSGVSRSVKAKLLARCSELKRSFRELSKGRMSLGVRELEDCIRKHLSCIELWYLQWHCRGRGTFRTIGESKRHLLWVESVRLQKHQVVGIGGSLPYRKPIGRTESQGLESLDLPRSICLPAWRQHLHR